MAKSESQMKHSVLITNSLPVLHGPRTHYELDSLSFTELGSFYQKHRVTLSLISQLKGMKELEDLIDSVR